MLSVTACTLPFRSPVGKTGTVPTTTPIVVSPIAIGETLEVGDMKIVVTDVTEDSRCPVDVQCIQAGRVVLDLDVTHEGLTEKMTLASDEPVEMSSYLFSLSSVTPDSKSAVVISKNEYRFVIDIDAIPTEEPEPTLLKDISWDDAQKLILNCDVTLVAQTHSLDVSLDLKDGSVVTAREPKIDAVFALVEKARKTCGDIMMMTE